ncbi:DEHA2F13354p [Debaryomyces hansenii CBS767]|uniref:DEHA2F13354p n=1 Tax=Debaryomyces hansenii (strain ATCC 36239 / CBS 767 / BCRC 21394 / JCM 1990 / NBRC 0083 / IGC 2968) TaxID=284592 RepID=Q6BLH7_DEBHA|nr:DEHA2F13354p [Debaryomyces hansenii CBS767]CAG89302.2 DEHA2F13354p [Debaryomyces hansenii CBS767]|eukprot:XP_460944.2 DEHA2F13354p [Debaryomyces hansenii CBS767]
MAGIADILNHSDGSDESNEQTTSSSTSNHRRTTSSARSSVSLDGLGVGLETSRGRRSIPKSKIDKKYLANKKLVQISIRRKSATRKSVSTENTSGVNTSKLHIKYLEAGMRVKLTMSPSIFSLYNSLIPHTNRKHVYALKDHHAVFDDISKKMETVTSDGAIINRNMTSKPLKLIDNNLVNLAGYSHKVLSTFGRKKDGGISEEPTHLPTFNSLDTAVSSLFGISDYTLVRVTRSTSNDDEGSVILKLETARPGDYSLIDDEDFLEDMVHSIGKPNDIPNSLFIKKIVARPRYKSDMKIFLIPKIQDSSLYVDERMFERDLINGVIDVDQSPSIRSIFCTFKFDHILGSYKNLLSLTKLDEEHNEKESNSDKDIQENPDIEMTMIDSN